MADEGCGKPRDDEARDQDQSASEKKPDEQHGGQAEFKMELCDSLPGGRAVVAVERKGEFIWLASRQHVSEQARDEFVEQLQRIVREGWWVQNWPGR